jgi:prenyltransferase beta subunit
VPPKPEKRDVPPHTLGMPKTWKLGVEQTVSLTIYDWTFRRRDITVTLYMKQCSCTKRPRFQRRCEEDEVFSSDKAESNPGQATILRIRLPRHDEVTDREFYISITSSVGETFVNKRRIFYGGSSRGMLMVRTDKPIYKPEQKVKFCILAMDSVTQPRAATVNVEIRDPRNRLIESWKNANVSKEGYVCLELQLADEPPMGRWRISIREVVDRGSCSWYYGALSESCNFEVKEFVLPKFEVKVDGPKYMTRDEDNIEGEVSAEYVFGEPVEGRVNVNFTLVASRRRENFLFHTIKTSLEKGKYTFSVPSEEYRRILRYRFDPFCVSSSIEVTAEVMEMGRETKYSSRIKFPLIANKVSFKFHEDMKETFKPGLPYNLKILSVNHDDTPAPKESFQLSVRANNGEVELVKPNKARKTDKNGVYETTIDIPSDINCIRIVVTPVKGEFSCEEGSICFSPVAAHSPSNCFMHLEVSNKNPKEGETITVTGTSTQEINYLQCMVTSHGNILSHKNYQTDSSGKNFKWGMEVTCNHSPHFQILCYFAREDGEICGDVMELEMECCSPHKVGMEFYKAKDSSLVDYEKEETVRPQTDLFVNVNSTPNTPVLVSVYDRSLSLLADFCDSGKQPGICRKLRSMTFGSVSINTRCDVTQKLQCKPVEWDEVQRIDINRILGFFGVSITSNMYLPRAPTVSQPAPLPRPIPGIRGPAPTTISVDVAIREKVTERPEEKAEETEEEQVRRFFPESWIFSVVETNNDGIGRVDTTAPDTITTWHGEAVAMSRNMGIGFSELTKLTVYKPFFVSLELPYSVNFGEKVVIKPVVFNFWEEDVEVKLNILVHEDLSIVGDTPDDLTVPAKSSESFDLNLLTRGIGRLRITIRAAVRGKKYSDTVEKMLFVKPGCVKYERASSQFIKGSDSDLSHTFSFTLPKCTIPKSHKATVVIKGDVMSVKNLHNLLVVPSGCGEQSMSRTAINHIVAAYLDSTEQLTDAIRARIMGNLKLGYQRQLNYQLFSGAFTVWPTSTASLWLTAFVLRSLSDVHTFYGEQSFIDAGVLRSAFNYIVSSQQKNGSFKRIGYTTNYRLLDDDVTMTAYVLIGLNRYPLADGRKAQTISKAVEYLVNYTTENDPASMCTYSLALTAYNLIDQDRDIRERIMTPLINAIKQSRNYPGACYVCNSCTMRRGSSDDETCEGEVPSKDPFSYDCVETTAYTLLTLLKAKDYRNTDCLAQWLVKKQNSFGSFGSSQDTIVALESLSMFAEHSFSPNLNLNVVVNHGGQSDTVELTDENRYTRHEIMVTDVPGDAEVTWSGEGTAIIQSVLTYHGCDCCNGSSCFELNARKTSKRDVVNVEACFRHKCEGRSNMGILDVELPSGCVHQETEVTLGDAEIEREERKGGSVVMYMDEVPKKTSCVRVTCERRFEIKDPKPAPITLYDYYMPTKRVTVFYETD